jgi:8-oxo-dGTP pyrophosphatase MutT (NUDIX family)
MSDLWYPHLTVATVVEKDGKFLIVEEHAEGEVVLNQPAGHVEQGESLVQAAQRETLEETCWNVSIDGYVGVALYTAASNGVTYCRHTFHGTAVNIEENAELDDGIIQALWLSMDDIQARQADWRSELLPQTIQQYLDGHRYPLNALYGAAGNV